jgi:threonine dehydratase
MVDVAAEALAAEDRIRPYLPQTPLLHADGVCYKLENRQRSGSFKARGAMNKLLSVPREMLARGIVAASTGNHGAAVAFAAQQLGERAIVFVPHTTPSSKLSAIAGYGAEIRLAGDDCIEAEADARRHSAAEGALYISPYNDPQVIGGQGTVAIELERQIEEIDVIFASLGGGGLISGIGGYLKSSRPEVEIVGCSPENSAVMIRSVEAGRILEIPSLPTISDGTAGGIEKDSITFDLCRSLVDRFITVTEDEIRHSLRRFMDIHGMVIEGAAAVAISSYLKTIDIFRGRRAVVIICGGNIDPALLKNI